MRVPHATVQERTAVFPGVRERALSQPFLKEGRAVAQVSMGGHSVCLLVVPWSGERSATCPSRECCVAT